MIKQFELDYHTFRRVVLVSEVNQSVFGVHNQLIYSSSTIHVIFLNLVQQLLITHTFPRDQIKLYTVEIKNFKPNKGGFTEVWWLD